MAAEGTYIYCIGEADRPAAYGAMGIGAQSDVRTVFADGLSALVSPSPVVTHAVTRANTMAHQLVMEKAMAHGPILPVRFGTIAEARNGIGPEEMIRDRLLVERGGEFRRLLDRMRDKVELGVKLLWTDLRAVYDEILAESADIRRLRAELQRRSTAPRGAKIRLGGMVKTALDAKRAREARILLRGLREISAEFRDNKISGDQMIANAAFLVADDRVAEFDRAVGELGERFEGRLRLKYVGPVPPCNFVEIVVSWD